MADEPTPAPKPIVADTAKCQAAAEAFLDACAAGCATPAEAYRNTAHAMGILKRRFVEVQTAAVAARRGA